MIVPQQAIIRDSRGVATVWVAAPDGHVERRDLSTVRTVGNAWLINGGLKPGDQVVTEGLQRINAYSTVKATPAHNVDLDSLTSSR